MGNTESLHNDKKRLEDDIIYLKTYITSFRHKIKDNYELVSILEAQIKNLNEQNDILKKKLEKENLFWEQASSNCDISVFDFIKSHDSFIKYDCVLNTDK